MINDDIDDASCGLGYSEGRDDLPESVSLKPPSGLTDAEREVRIHQLHRDGIKAAAGIFEASVRREYEQHDPSMHEYMIDMTPSDKDLSADLLNSPAGELLSGFADWMNASPEDFMERANTIAEVKRSEQADHGKKPKWWSGIIYKEAQRLKAGKLPMKDAFDSICSNGINLSYIDNQSDEDEISLYHTIKGSVSKPIKIGTFKQNYWGTKKIPNR